VTQNRGHGGPSPDARAPLIPAPVAEVARVFLRLGCVGFGGPVAHLALMQDELVDKRGWVDRPRYLQLVAVTNLIPGPNSSEVAIHLGYVRAGLLGGLVAGVGFALPSFLLMLGLSWLYFSGGDAAWARDLFDVVQPAVVAVVAWAAARLAPGAIRGPLTAAIALAAFLLAAFGLVPEALVLLGAGAVGLALRGPRPARRMMAATPIAGAAASLANLPALAWVALKTGLLMFGGGLVIVPLLEPEVVSRGWLTRPEFLDGVALGQITPGPVTLTLAFVGWAAAGPLGALVASVVVYVPAFVGVLFGTGPFLRVFAENRWLRAALWGITPAVVGAIAGVVPTLARASWQGWTSAVILAAAAVALLRLPPAVVLVGAAAVGLLVAVT
jgi:chromate transporter